jgi:hypothetical protein
MVYEMNDPERLHATNRTVQQVNFKLFFIES